MPLRPFAVALAVLLAGCDSVGVELAPEPEAQVQAWDEMLEAVNAVRTAGATCGARRMPAVAPLAWDGRLETAAVRHSEDMARTGRFDHTGSDGTDAGERALKAGYDWRIVGENIARRQRTVAEVVEDWVASPAHCRQLMEPGFVEVGAAERDGYWTQVFGRPR